MDGGGNLADSNIEWVDDDLTFTVAPDASVQILVAGAGGQLFVKAANGDETHVGGELTLQSGSSEGQSGGQVNVVGGDDSGGGDGGNILIKSGKATFAGEGGNAGDIDLRAGGGEVSDGNGGNILITGGSALDGHGGNVEISAGPSTNGAEGTLLITNDAGTESIFISDDGVAVTASKQGFFGTAPVVRPQVPASPDAQDIVDTLVALGLITQAA